MHQQLIQFFERLGTLQDQDKALLSDYWPQKPLIIKSKAMLLLAGQVERQLYYVAEGNLRIYFTDEEGAEICVGFAYPDTLLASFPSFLHEKPSEFSIQALSKATLYPIGRTALYELRNQSLAIEKAWQRLLEDALVGLIERESAMLIQDPRARLQKLLQRSPHIFQRIPQKYIASYLRMQPETLSRIYRELELD